MRCLCYFQPPKDLCTRLEAEPYVVAPKSGLHCTIWGFNINRGSESEVANELESLILPQFSVRIRGVSRYTDAYGFTLDKPLALQELHDEIIRIAIKYDKNSKLFRQMLSKYGRANFNPHIQISKHEIPLIGQYIDYEMLIGEYLLLKKPESDWQKVKAFKLRQ